MKKPIVTEPAGTFDLGLVLGQRRAFSAVAGKCSAADAATLKQIRDGKLYLSICSDWSQFCNQHLHMSKSTADKLIALLTEFGPDYFTVAQFTGISPAAYRAIAPSVRDSTVRYMGADIALTSENADKVAQAVQELRRIAAPAAPLTPPTRVSPRQRLESLEKCSRNLVDGLTELADSAPGCDDREEMLQLVRETRKSLVRVELRMSS
jgi:hypothetical protein